MLLPIKDLINKDGEPTTSFKLVTGMKHSILHLRVLFCPCVVWKPTAHVGTKSLNMSHQAQKCFAVSSLELYSIKKGILFMYHTNRRLYLRTNFYEIFSSELIYTLQPYAEAVGMQPAVSYITYDTYSRGKWRFNQIRTVLSGNKYDDDSYLAPLINE